MIELISPNYCLWGTNSLSCSSHICFDENHAVVTLNNCEEMSELTHSDSYNSSTSVVSLKHLCFCHLSLLDVECCCDNAAVVICSFSSSSSACASFSFFMFLIRFHRASSLFFFFFLLLLMLHLFLLSFFLIIRAQLPHSP